MYIAGDIGATKTLLGAYSDGKDFFNPIVEKQYSSNNYQNFETILDEFLAELDEIPKMAVFGVAGYASGYQARTTNLSWLIHAGVIQEQFSIGTVHILNDVEAMAYAVPVLDVSKDITVVHRGIGEGKGVRAVIAPGTGLGEAFFTWDGDKCRVYPSEGGHTDFAPASEIELELLSYLKRRYRHVSCELVCSGIGISNIYDFFIETGKYTESPWLREKIAIAGNKTHVIIDAFLDPSCSEPLCAATLNLFISILGAEAGNLALKVLATGGMYLGGGIPKIITTALSGGSFLKSFTDKGRCANLLSSIPVYVIKNERTVLVGAAAFALKFT